MTTKPPKRGTLESRIHRFKVIWQDRKYIWVVVCDRRKDLIPVWQKYNPGRESVRWMRGAHHVMTSEAVTLEGDPKRLSPYCGTLFLTRPFDVDAVAHELGHLALYWAHPGKPTDKAGRAGKREENFCHALDSIIRNVVRAVRKRRLIDKLY